MEVVDAVALAKEYVTEAIRRAFPLGQGHGPLNHFYKLWG
jgi:hydroxymethylpyrimidine/phosphomethylpyrimidine kinase